MIPRGYRATGQGLSLFLRMDVTPAGADGVISSPMIPGPFLVVAVELFRKLTGQGTVQVTVVDVPLRVDPVAGVLVPIIGTHLFPTGPTRAALPGAGEEPLIGPLNLSVDAVQLWPWYLREQGGAIALWVRRPGAFAAGATAAVSVWYVEREVPEDVSGFLGQRPWLRIERRPEVGYREPYVSVFR